MIRTIVQAGHPVLRQRARPLELEELRSRAFSDLVEAMRETMHSAPGVGLAAPQIGLGLQLAVIEDSADLSGVDPKLIALLQREPVGFHVLVNPRIVSRSDDSFDWFEGCLSVEGMRAAVPRSRSVKVQALDHHGEPVVLEAVGWYARILQHEIDHLSGTLYIDRMDSRTLCTVANHAEFWAGMSPEQMRSKLGPALT